MTEPEETKISLPVAKPEPVVEQREPTSEPSPLPTSPTPAPTNEEKTNDILDDLLGLNTKKEKGTDLKRKLSFKFLRRYKV